MSTPNLSALFLLLAGILLLLAAVSAHSFYLAGIGAAAVLAGRLSHSPTPTN
jgi:membrane protein implicated in regulation of membrane protease activity